jgi:hypothetical protein
LTRFRILLGLAFSAAGIGCSSDPPRIHAALSPASTYADYGDQVVVALKQNLWAGNGLWFNCDGGCGSGNKDWGNDSLTFVLYFRWLLTRDASLATMFTSLTASATAYGSSSCNDIYCFDWSDMPMWDAIADEREYEVTRDPRALDLAGRAYRHVQKFGGYTAGACPEIHFQRPGAAGGGLKTLETDSNGIKAALLLWQQTGDPGYLADATATYAAVRKYFLDPQLPLYTVYVFDDGRACTQVPGRFFASVNGNMIWAGLSLAEATGDDSYFQQAAATADAIDKQLSDGRAIFANLLAENDIAEPLVEAMYDLSVRRGVASARDWLLRNADAAIRNARVPDGLFGRFFNGPPQVAAVTEFQSNGGLALAVAAASLDPAHTVPLQNDWAQALAVNHEILTLPSTLSFSGSGIALIGTLGEQCCEPGHAGLVIDGLAPTDTTGIWQNKSSTNQTFDDAVLFAWQWAQSGNHSLTLTVPDTNAKEGGPFIHIRKYLVIP